MALKKITYIFIFMFGVAGILWTQEANETALSLEECIALALRQNPLLLSSLEQYKASLARINQAKAIPQPSINIDSDLQPNMFNFKDSGESYFGFSQTVEFPGKRLLRGKIALRESDEILSEIDLLKLDISFQVKQAFYGLLLAQERLKYAQQDLELSRDFLNKAELKQAAGDVAKVEVLRARVEASKAANAVRVAQNEKRLAAAQLNFFLGRKKFEPIEIQGEIKRPFIKLDIEELRQRAFSFRPEIKRINFALEKEALKKKQGYLSYLPDFDIGISQHRLVGEKKVMGLYSFLSHPSFFLAAQKR